MVLRSILGSLLLPPILLILAGLVGALLAWRGWRSGAALAALAAAAQLLLATPLAAGLLMASLEREVASGAPEDDGAAPGAIVVLSFEVARGREKLDVGPMTLERLRAGAALHRRTGLPLLVSGGRISPEDEPLAALMARSLAEDFGVRVRWAETRSRNTWENAAFSADMLREDGTTSAYVVTHGWHMPRALAAFAQHRFHAVAAPVRLDRAPTPRAGDFVPHAGQLGWSWFALREWAGRLFYAVRG